MPKQTTSTGAQPETAEGGHAAELQRSAATAASAATSASATGESAPRPVGRRKSQFLVASRQNEGLVTLGLMPLQSSVIEQALRNSPDVEIVDVIRPKATIGAFGTGLGDSGSVMVARMPDEKAGMLQQQGQGRLIVEKDQSLHLLDPAFAAPGLVSGFSTAATAPTLVTIMVSAGNGSPVAEAEVYLFGSLLPATATTDQQGRAVLSLYGETPESITALYVKPKSDYWSFYQRNPDIDFNTPNLVGLRPLSDWPALAAFPQQQTLGWGQKAMRLDRLPPQLRGKGVKIAVIDSGAAARTHDDLKGVHLGVNILDKKNAPEGWTQDLIAHGSHCTGVIAGADGPHGVRGFAPDAEVHVCKLFPGGQVSQLIDALEYCIEQQIDVVNLSLGGAAPSEALEQQLQRAKRAGIACVVAAGNSGDTVQYPASSPHVLCVAAIGKLGEFPHDSYHGETVGSAIDPDGFFSARFSCHGQRVDVCAPGVAIPSSVPDNNFAVWDGTSMAAPHVTGLAALVLAHHPDFQQRYATRGAERVERLFQIIRMSTRPLNLGDPGRTGLGLPDVLIALGLAPPLQPGYGATLGAGAGAQLGGAAVGNALGNVLGTALGGGLGSALSTPIGSLGGMFGGARPTMATMGLQAFPTQLQSNWPSYNYRPAPTLGELERGLGGWLGPQVQPWMMELPAGRRLW